MPRRPRIRLTPDLLDRVVQLIRAGNFPTVAARACGISHNAYYDWINRAQKGDSRYVPFLKAIEDAEYTAQAHLVAVVRQAAAHDWKAALALLERRWPDEWAKKESPLIEATIQPQAPLPPEERDRMMRIASRVYTREEFARFQRDAIPESVTPSSAPPMVEGQGKGDESAPGTESRPH